MTGPFRTDLIAVFDTETTDADPETARIVTAFVGVMNKQGELIEKHSWLINPGVEISEGAAAVHGITNERAQAEGMDAKEAVYQIDQRLDILDRAAIPLVIYNAPFDTTILDRELRRHWSLEHRPNSVILDPLVIGKKIDKYARGGWKLVDAAARYGVPVRADAHDAEADCVMAGQLALKFLEHPWMKELSLSDINRRTIKHKRDQSLHYYEYRMSPKGLARSLENGLTVEEHEAGNKTIYGFWPMVPFGHTTQGLHEEEQA